MNTIKNTSLSLVAACTSAVYLMCATPASAESPKRFSPDEGWSFSASLDTVKIKSDSAYREWVSDSAYDFSIAAEHYTRNNPLVFGLGMSFIGYDDNGGFSQLTNKGSRNSNASAMSLFAEIGTRYWLTPTQDSFASVHFGISSLIDSKRSIDYCSNCYSENINLDGGTYGALRLGHRFNSFDLSLQYQKFFTGDFDSLFGIKIATNF